MANPIEYCPSSN